MTIKRQENVTVICSPKDPSQLNTPKSTLGSKVRKKYIVYQSSYKGHTKDGAAAAVRTTALEGF